MGGKGSKMTRSDFEKKYAVREVLGRGSFATVKRCVRKKDKKEMAVKIISKKKLNEEELYIVHEEVKIMTKIASPHCVQLFEIFETNKRLYLVMELLTGGELFDMIVAKGSYSEAEASAVIKCVTSALKYLHGIGIVHRDLKPENLIYATQGARAEIKITDFGLAKLKRKDAYMSTACGTPGYVAPEVLKKQKYTEAVDVWSLGVILYILLCGFPPFYHESTHVLYKQIKEGDYDFPAEYWRDITDAAKDLIRRMLTVDPRKRITINGILAHPWIAGSAASERKFDGKFTVRLKKLQARKQLRRAVQLIIAVNRFSHSIDLYHKQQRARRLRGSRPGAGVEAMPE